MAVHPNLGMLLWETATLKIGLSHKKSTFPFCKLSGISIIDADTSVRYHGYGLLLPD